MARVSDGPYLGSCLEYDWEGVTESHCASCHEDEDWFGIQMSTAEDENGWWTMCCRSRAKFLLKKARDPQTSEA